MSNRSAPLGLGKVRGKGPAALENLNRVCGRDRPTLGQAAQRLFGSFRNLAKRPAESLRNRLIPAVTSNPNACRAIQIRRNSF